MEQRTLAKVHRARGSNRLMLVGATDFSAIGSGGAVDIGLHRLTRQGAIQRLARGLYYVPRVHSILGEISPSSDAIVDVLVSKHRLRAQPSGAYAANLLGLSEQVPLRVVYLIDSPTRRISVGKQEIVLKRTTPKNMATAGRISGLIIQALRHLGKRHLDRAVVAKLQKRLGPAERAPGDPSGAAIQAAWYRCVARRCHGTHAPNREQGAGAS